MAWRRAKRSIPAIQPISLSRTTSSTGSISIAFTTRTGTGRAPTKTNMCPDFFPLGDRHMLLFISHNLGCQYYIGRYKDDHFYPDTHGRMTWADNSFFAPESLLDERGRRIMWAWFQAMVGRRKHKRTAAGRAYELAASSCGWAKTIRCGWRRRRNWLAPHQQRRYIQPERARRR